MIDCNKCRKLFKKSVNNELLNSEKELFENHLSSCDECAREFDELKSTVEFMRQHRTNEVRDEFMDNLWLNIQPELIKHNGDKTFTTLSNKLTGFINFRPALMQQLAGAAAILIVGIFLGRYFFIDNQSGVDSLPSQVNIADNHASAVLAKADNYIERSKVLLLGLTNFDPKVDDVETISLPHQQNISRRLLTDAADLKAELNKPSQANLRQLVSDLEMILMQIANLETEYDLSGIELVKQGVDRRGIFLKINIREMQREKISSTQPTTNEKKNNNI